MKGKLFIFSAPSGSGKTTIVNSLLKSFPTLEFSISATSRKPRKGEMHGREYYFITPDEFRQKIKNEEFVEWEEVYKDAFYGTLKSEIDRIWQSGKHLIFDVDVMGGLNLKRKFSEQALAVFVSVPAIEDLEKRLKSRSTDSEETIQKRLAKAKHELTFKNRFDIIILNDKLENAVKEAESVVKKFLEEE